MYQPGLRWLVLVSVVEHHTVHQQNLLVKAAKLYCLPGLTRNLTVLEAWWGHQHPMLWLRVQNNIHACIISRDGVNICTFFNKDWQLWSWRTTVLQSLAPTAIKTHLPVAFSKTLISLFRHGFRACSGLGLELNSSGQWPSRTEAAHVCFSRTNCLRVNPNSLSYPFPFPLPLSFAHSRERKGYPNSCFDRGVGLRVSNTP